MKKYLLPDKQQYKANLHCHSTISDGRFTPAELKDIYKAHGYSILAISDHEALVPHTDLKDDGFLPITASEVGVMQTMEGPWWAYSSMYHINFFSKDPERNTFFDFKRIYTPDAVNVLLEKAEKEGFVAQLNHVRWSYQQKEDYLPLKGCRLFEIYNTGCDTEVGNGTSDAEYDLLLRNGNYMVPTANDDNHNHFDLSSPNSDSFGGYNMLCMDDLSYDSFFAALENGDLYATTGPVINELSVVDGKLHIECSACRRIFVRTNWRCTATVLSHSTDITCADIDLDLHFPFEYIRVELYDDRGVAYTRAYLADEVH